MISFLTTPRAPVAQWIERLPPEQEVAGSSPAGRIVTSIEANIDSIQDAAGNLMGEIRPDGIYTLRSPEVAVFVTTAIRPVRLRPQRTGHRGEPGPGPGPLGRSCR